MTVEWEVLDKIIQWLIIPLVVVAYILYQRVNSQEKEILRILTILEERERRRNEDRETELSANKALKESIDKLNTKLDDMMTKG